MSSKIIAVIGLIVGGLAAIFELLVAFGVNITANQQTAIAAVAGLVLAVVSAWFHPNIPVGIRFVKKVAPPGAVSD